MAGRGLLVIVGAVLMAPRPYRRWFFVAIYYVFAGIILWNRLGPR